MSFDSGRFFPISDDVSSSSSKLKRGDLSQDSLISLAKRITEKCCNHSSRKGSLYTGGLGPHVYLRLKLAQRIPANDTDYNSSQERKALLVKAKHAADYALQQSASSSFRVSLLEGKWVGAKCLLAAIEHQLGNPKKAQNHAQEVVERLEQECSSLILPSGECEILYGRAGALQAIFFLRSELQDSSLGQAFCIATAKHILRQGLHEAQRQQHISGGSLPLLWRWHEKIYLGAAHGIVGILQTLLYLQAVEWQAVEQDFPNILQTITKTIEYLSQNCCLESGNLKSSVSNTADRLVHWCHGAPGLCLLLIQCSRVFPSKKTAFLDQGQNIAENVIWPRGLLKKGLGLCHGISGNALVLLRCAVISEDLGGSAAYRYNRAMHYVKFAIDRWEELEPVPDRPYSLFEGLGGVVCLLLACGSAASSSELSASKFPLYEH